jgi:hypothetical protein
MAGVLYKAKATRARSARETVENAEAGQRYNEKECAVKDFCLQMLRFVDVINPQP